MRNIPIIRSFGEHTLLLEWPAEISLATHNEVMRYTHAIESEFRNELLDVVPAYHSIAIYFQRPIGVTTFMERLKECAAFTSEKRKESPQLISIPVCYAEEFALDMLALSEQLGLSNSELINLHTQPRYKVYFMGFLPGFVYLGGLPSKLHVPRQQTPRPKIECGSVGIGGQQTGIYPVDSPGGWNIIGKTPMPLFTAEVVPPVLIQIGDYIKFESITKSEYQLIQAEIEMGTYQIRREAADD